jgi:hypothetical protein
MVERRCATISIVPIFIIFSREFWIRSSVSVSILAVASSSIITAGLWIIVLAKERS